MLRQTRWTILIALCMLTLVLAACAQTAAPAGDAEEAPAAAEGDSAEVAEDVTTEEDMSTGMSADASPYINLCEGEPVDGGSIT
ncbi:MAG: hypothetical protein KDE53_08860, partial [Caldilineaceae bacterium]|nr:hypothetical protein [Caldilineaceae bacterium]